MKTIKKISAMLMTITMLVSLFFNISISAHAEPTEKTVETIIHETTEYFEDGSSLTIIVTEVPTAMTAGDFSAIAQTDTYLKAGAKHYIFSDEDHNELWRFTVHGTFTVDPGVSATCTKDSFDFSISDDSWHNESASSYHSGNQAIGDAIFIRKILLLTVGTQTCHVTLTCDSNGNLT